MEKASKVYYKREKSFDLLQRIKVYKKLDYDKLKDQPFEIQPYLLNMNLRDACTMFRIKSEMVKSVKMCYMSIPEYSNQMWKCNFCEGCKLAMTNLNGTFDYIIVFFTYKVTF